MLLILRRSGSRLTSHLLDCFALQARVCNLRCDCLVRTARFSATVAWYHSHIHRTVSGCSAASTLSYETDIATSPHSYLYNDAKTRSSNSASDSKIRRDERTTLPTTRGDLPALYVPAPLPRQHQAPISGLGIRSAGSHMSSRSVGVLGTDRRDHGAGNMPLFDPRASIPSPPESGRGSDDGLAHIGQQKRD